MIENSYHLPQKTNRFSRAIEYSNVELKPRELLSGRGQYGQTALLCWEGQRASVVRWDTLAEEYRIRIAFRLDNLYNESVGPFSQRGG